MSSFPIGEEMRQHRSSLDLLSLPSCLPSTLEGERTKRKGKGE